MMVRGYLPPFIDFPPCGLLSWAHSHLALRVPMAARGKTARPFETGAHSVVDDMTVLKFFRYPEREMFIKYFTEF